MWIRYSSLKAYISMQTRYLSVKVVKIMLSTDRARISLPSLAFPEKLQCTQLSVCVYTGSLPQRKWAAKTWPAKAVLRLKAHQIQLKTWFIGSLPSSSLPNIWAAGISEATACTMHPHKLQLVVDATTKNGFSYTPSYQWLCLFME